MITIDMQVCRSKVRVKVHVGLPHLVQRITQEGFVPHAYTKYIVLDEFMIPIDIQVSMLKVKFKAKLIIVLCWGRGIIVYKHLLLHYSSLIARSISYVN